MSEAKNPNPEKQYVVSHGVLRAVLDYLSQRPYGEVFALVQGIQMVREYVETPAKSEGEQNESGK